MLRMLVSTHHHGTTGGADVLPMAVWNVQACRTTEWRDAFGFLHRPAGQYSFRARVSLSSKGPERRMRCQIGIRAVANCEG